MVTVTVLAGLAGGLLIAGLAVLLLEFMPRDPGLTTPPRARIRISPRSRRQLLIATCAGLVTFALTRWPVAMAAAVLAVLFLPRITSSRAARHRAAVLEGLEQWTRRVADMLTASRGLEEALEASARQAPAAIGPPVRALGRRLAARTGTEAALRAFAADIDDPAGDRIAAALIIATGQRGGAVRQVLNALAVMLARDVATRREIEADRAQHRTTVKWLTLFVLGFTVFAAANRSYSAPYGTVPGQLVMALVTSLYAGGLLWLHHLGSVRVPGRFLAGDASPAPGVSAANTWLRQTGDRPATGRLRQAAGRLTKARPWQRGSSAPGKHSTGSRRPA
ncbi:MAG TPA: type II secretion system F family protein [Streptosporangiaceae bacterium]|nr:type II secretion system F family protein [Streptosporangiaceae bacterium]